jgi:hypothetical protein
VPIAPTSFLLLHKLQGDLHLFWLIGRRRLCVKPCGQPTQGCLCVLGGFKIKLDAKSVAGVEEHSAGVEEHSDSPLFDQIDRDLAPFRETGITEAMVNNVMVSPPMHRRQFGLLSYNNPRNAPFIPTTRQLLCVAPGVEGLTPCHWGSDSDD